ncbi:uncharacterized protein AMSG_08497 [Thecamonas trahens ATCC 50062]|uniref:Uncharacterized protein n=1 Tax=Thecamonas trahens ATCC 50062 TaxID=461836 RepID=A0A0L0DML3_THETB|nr:hypothetical protein AMSG_08497 [Thecamonas trahens ATCC 50062]KNC52628.1 hypothetical protein AMSG_08497 [Thecamonas trahens ATCC 50062]|eukprot:XP_013755184.1 hypothetical protein AMSG_08497 [Thecamonas trahens ATCC 50062]
MSKKLAAHLDGEPLALSRALQLARERTTSPAEARAAALAAVTAVATAKGKTAALAMAHSLAGRDAVVAAHADALADEAVWKALGSLYAAACAPDVTANAAAARPLFRALLSSVLLVAMDAAAGAGAGGPRSAPRAHAARLSRWLLSLASSAPGVHDEAVAVMAIIRRAMAAPQARCEDGAGGDGGSGIAPIMDEAEAAPGGKRRRTGSGASGDRPEKRAKGLAAKVGAAVVDQLLAGEAAAALQSSPYFLDDVGHALRSLGWDGSGRVEAALASLIAGQPEVAGHVVRALVEVPGKESAAFDPMGQLADALSSSPEGVDALLSEAAAPHAPRGALVWLDTLCGRETLASLLAARIDSLGSKVDAVLALLDRYVALGVAPACGRAVFNVVALNAARHGRTQPLAKVLDAFAGGESSLLSVPDVLDLSVEVALDKVLAQLCGACASAQWFVRHFAGGVLALADERGSAAWQVMLGSEAAAEFVLGPQAVTHFATLLNSATPDAVALFAAAADASAGVATVRSGLPLLAAAATPSVCEALSASVAQMPLETALATLVADPSSARAFGLVLQGLDAAAASGEALPTKVYRLLTKAALCVDDGRLTARAANALAAATAPVDAAAMLLAQRLALHESEAAAAAGVAWVRGSDTRAEPSQRG